MEAVQEGGGGIETSLDKEQKTLEWPEWGGGQFQRS